MFQGNENEPSCQSLCRIEHPSNIARLELEEKEGVRFEHTRFVL